MTAGELRSRIKILKRIPQDGPVVEFEGSKKEEESEKNFKEIHNVACKREDRLNEKIWGSQAENAIRKKQLTIRFIKDINESMRVVLNGHSYEILATAEPDQRKQWLMLLIKEVVNVGI